MWADLSLFCASPGFALIRLQSIRKEVEGYQAL